ncbi:hypothetical protein SODG_001564 [Sodalis praecaptivus]
MTPAALTRLVLKAYVSGRLPALETSLATLPTSVGQAFRQQRDTLLAFIDRLPDAEITATAGLPDEITAVTAALAREIGPADKRPLDKHCGFPLPVKHPVMRGKWAVDPGFDRAWDEGMTLVIRPAEHELRLWVQKGVRAWHSAWQGAGGANVAPSCDDALARLSALVQGNALGLLAVTRLLNPAGIEQALGQRILSPFDGGQPDRICYQGLWLLSAKPTVSFEVSSEEGVNIDATLSWPIVRYGPRSRCDITPLETGSGNAVQYRTDTPGGDSTRNRTTQRHAGARPAADPGNLAQQCAASTPCRRRAAGIGQSAGQNDGRDRLRPVRITEPLLRCRLRRATDGESDPVDTGGDIG